MEAIILAGGKGTRLAGVLPGVPKAVAPVAGQPFLFYLLAMLARQGFTRYILAVGHLAPLVEEAMGHQFGGIPIDYVYEEEPLGTGGAIHAALRQIQGERAFIFNGDTYVGVDCRGMERQHMISGDRLSVALVEVPDVARYGAVQFHGTRIERFSEKGLSGPGFINSGVYLMEKHLLDDLGLPKNFSWESEVLTKRINYLQPAAFPCRAPFIDIGVPEDYERAHRELPGMDERFAALSATD